MANRDLTDFRTVINQVAENPSNLLGAAAEFGLKAIEDSQKAKITEAISAAALDIEAMNFEYRNKMSSDPMGALEKMKADRKRIFDQYEQGISPFYKKMWQQEVRSLAMRDDAANQQWALKQSQVNTVNSVNNAIKNNLKAASAAGMQFGQSDDATLDSVLKYGQTASSLMNFASESLGQEKAQGLLAGYRKDYMKSFVSGVAQSNPLKAAKLLENEQVRAAFEPDDISAMEKFIVKQNKQQKLGSLFQQMERESAVVDMVNATEGDYLSKRVEIDTMELNGEISKETATVARRVLTSKKSVDAVTNNEAMSEIITRIYDLNAISDRSSEDYLTGINNVRMDILKRQDDGQLSVQDAQKLQNQLKTLTSAKVADATQRVGYSFYEARKIFDTQLSPEYRAEATRQLFYASGGDINMSKEEMNRKAFEIVNDIKKSTREKVINRTKKIVMPDEEFLKTTVNKATGKPYTIDDVRETAKIYGMTEAQVIQILKDKK